MALVLADRVRETTTTVGTGTVTLAGAVTGYQSFSIIGNANTTFYAIAGQGTSEWEVGIGTYTMSGTTLARTTILSSSNSGSAVNFSAGTKDVFVTYPSSKSVNLDASGNVTLAGTLTVTGATTLSSALTYGGVTLSNAVTGTGNMVLSTSPTLVTPALGTPSALVGTNITGTASGLTAGNVTTNANLTGPITSVGNATSIASQTGTGTTFVMSASPTVTGTFSGATINASVGFNGVLGGTTPAAASVTTLAASGTTTLSSALTYGGVTLSNAVTGTGNMVLSASPTLTGTLTAAAITASGAITNSLSANGAGCNVFTSNNTGTGAGVGTSVRLQSSGTNVSKWQWSYDGAAFTTDILSYGQITLSPGNNAGGNTTSVTVNTTGINGILGGTTPAAASVTTLAASGASTLTGDVTIGNASSLERLLNIVNTGAVGNFSTMRLSVNSVRRADFTTDGNNVYFGSYVNIPVLLRVNDATVVSLTPTGASVTGTLGVSGASTLTGDVTIGNASSLIRVLNIVNTGAVGNFSSVSLSVNSLRQADLYTDGNNAYVGSYTNIPLLLRVNNVTVASLTSAGASVTGTLGVSGTITGAGSIISSATNTLVGVNTGGFQSGSIVDGSGNTCHLWIDASASANNKYWDIIKYSGGNFAFRVMNDARTASAEWLNVSGGFGAGITGINFPCGAPVSVTGTLGVTGAITVTGGGYPSATASTITMVGGANPSLVWSNNSATANNSKWDFVAVGSQLVLRAIADNNSTTINAILITRNATTSITNLDFTANATTFSGTLGVTGAVAIGNTVAAAVAVASTHKVTMVIGGVTYYLLASNV